RAQLLKESSPSLGCQAITMPGKRCPGRQLTSACRKECNQRPSPPQSETSLWPAKPIARRAHVRHGGADVSLLGLLSWRYFRRHVLRTLLTTAGIVLGVTVLVGLHVANRSVVTAFSRTIDRIAGKTD